MSDALLAIVKNGKIELVDTMYIPEGTRLLVTPIPAETIEQEQKDWETLSLQELERAYGDDEPEYTLDLIKEWNPEYEGS